jgi:hypothetical protein
VPLLNFTTKVPVSRTLDEVQRLLVRAGARSVSTAYSGDGNVEGLAFQVETAYGPRWFSLPINVEPVLAVLVRQRVENRFRTPEQAERVAWRILKDWVEAQLAIIETGMVTLDQVMLPYMHGDESGRTVYEVYLDGQRALPAGGS